MNELIDKASLTPPGKNRHNASLSEMHWIKAPSGLSRRNEMKDDLEERCRPALEQMGEHVKASIIELGHAIAAIGMGRFDDGFDERTVVFVKYGNVQRFLEETSWLSDKTPPRDSKRRLWCFRARRSNVRDTAHQTDDT